MEVGMSESVITRKGQVTIPKEIRNHLKAKEGERVVFVLRGDEVVLKVARGNILDLKGSVKPKERPENTGLVRQSVKRAVGKRIARNG
jgi:AbrB family looped-hinge helix DNA binding protein